MLNLMHRNRNLKIWDIDFGEFGQDILRCLNCIHQYYQSGAAYEIWQGELVKLKEENPEIYDFVLHELLAWAAGKDDLVTFRRLLDTGEINRFTRRMKVWGIINWKEFFHFLKKNIPWCWNTLFITEKEVFLDEMVKRLGIPRICHQRMETYIAGDNGEVYQTYLPEAYLAIQTGNLHMAEYFIRKKGYGSGVLESDVLEKKDADIAENDEEMTILEGCGDVLTAALSSGSDDMVDLILRNFPDLPWSRNLFLQLMRAKDTTVQLVLQYHPELPEFVDLRDIAANRHWLLLKVCLEKCARTGENPEEQLLVSAEGNPFWLRKDIRRSQRVTAFYRKAFSVFQDLTVRKGFLRMLYADYLRLLQKSLADLFIKYRYLEHDFTDYLQTTQRWQDMLGNEVIFELDSLCDFYETYSTEAFPVDIYKIAKENCLSKKQIGRILQAVVPVRIENQSDGLFLRMVKLNDAELVNKAIKQGFITGKNFPALFKEANRLHAGSQIKTTLMKMQNGESLMKRYEI